MKLRVMAFFLSTSFALHSSVSLAAYPGMDSSMICNGYPTFTGQVTKFNSTTTYDGYEATWIELTNRAGVKSGGKLYDREPMDRGYIPMINSARLAFITGAKARICINGNDIYAVELFQE
jgi:hypothetical protein